MSQPTHSTSRCFEEGVDARAQGKPLSENPYCIRTEDHKEWQAGWYATLDLDEDDDPQSMRASDCIRLGDD